MHVVKVHWIVVEDSYKRTDLVTKLLQRCDVASTHLTITRFVLLDIVFETSWRGLEQRNLALSWLRAQCGIGPNALFGKRDTLLANDSCNNGVVYFGDDDNKYDLRLFEQVSLSKLNIGKQGLSRL